MAFSRQGVRIAGAALREAMTMGAGKRTIRCMAVTGLISIFALAGATSARAADILLERQHIGLTLRAAGPAHGKKFDTSVLPAKEALARIANALDRLVSGSPHSARQLRRLTAGGRVILTYKPGDLKRAHGGESVANFLPDYRRHTSMQRRQQEFRVVIGRHGVKWPVDELAATLAHELSGHATQQFRGRLTAIRYLDAECEANLHEEIANQELGLDKSSRRMVMFRYALETHWCADFKKFMRRHRPGALPLWDRQNPDIPALLAIFEQYLRHTIKTGAVARAMDALKHQIRESRRRAYQDASPAMLLQIARKLRNGAIGIRPDAEEASRYVRIAAEAKRDLASSKTNAATLDSPGTMQNSARPDFRRAIDPLR